MHEPFQKRYSEVDVQGDEQRFTSSMVLEVYGEGQEDTQRPLEYKY